jgi:hypothetical protein
MGSRSKVPGSYHEQLTSHLSTYRKDVLKVGEPGVFKHHGQTLSKEYILAPDQRSLNLLPGARALIENYLREHPVALHRYFHHLNSSQAFTLNLFVPFFEGDPPASECLLRSLGVEGSLNTWKPEEIPHEEEETNIDVSWSLTNGKRYLCEVKLSENGFGKAQPDQEHVDKIRKTYAPVLQGRVDDELLETTLFCKHYQILRLAWCAVQDDTVTLIFLLPRANERLWQQVAKIKPHLGKALRDRICEVAMEDVLEKLVQRRELSPELQEHARALKLKYVVPNLSHV